MSIDIYHSRRDRVVKCPFWIRDERDKSGSPSQWVVYNQPSGSFWAKPLSPKSTQMNVVNGVWALDRNNITLETDDNVEKLDRGSIVKFDDQLWLVDAVQRNVHLKESEFHKKIQYKYVISLTKG